MQNIEQERNSWLKLTILLIYIFGFGLLTVFGGDGDLGVNLDDTNMIALLKIGQVIGVIILFILPAVLFSVFWTNQRIHYIGLTTKPALSTLLIAATGMLLAMPMINWLADLNQHMQLPESMKGIETWMQDSEDKAAKLTDAFTRGTSFSSLIANLFVIAFMAALSEEIFFRGILQKVLIECFKNKHVGVWIGAILFSAFHMQFFGFVPRMLMGAYLGYMFLWSGSLWPGMIAHFVNNGVAVFLVWLANRGSIAVDADKIGIEQNQWIYILTSGIMIAVSLVMVYRIEQRRKLEELNK